MAAFLQDLRYGLRALIRAPGFSLVAIAVLALGIGGNAVVFSLANAFFLRPLPVSDPDHVIRVYSNRYSNTPYRSYVEFRDRNSTLAGLAASQIRSFGLRIDAEAEHAFGSIVSGEYFSVLGIQPARGRLLHPSDDQPDASPAVVLSHSFWNRRFGGAPEAIGRTMSINDQPFTIVGVAAEGFTGVVSPLTGDLWVPLAADPVLRPGLELAARVDSISLHPLAQAYRPLVNILVRTTGTSAAARATIVEAVRAIDPALIVFNVVPLDEAMSVSLLPVQIAGSLLAALGMLALLLAGLGIYGVLSFIVRSRTREIGIRVALGATRGAVVAMVLRQALAWTVAGVGIGMALAFVMTRFLAAFLYGTTPTDPLTFGAVIVLLVLIAGIAALVPAVRASRLDPFAALRIQ